MEKILIQFPTRERPKKFFEYLTCYVDLLENKEDFLIHVSCDTDDITMNNARVKERVFHYPNTIITFNDNKTKIEAVNAGVSERDFNIIILASDDMIPQVKGYDTIIRNAFKEHFPDGDGVLHFNDGFQGEKLNTLSIMTRKYYDRFGYLYNPIYKSFYPDNEFDDISRILNKRVYIDEVIIRHEHPGNVSEVVFDDLYKRNHSFVKEDKATYNARKAIQYGLYIAGADPYRKGREGLTIKE